MFDVTADLDYHWNAAQDYAREAHASDSMTREAAEFEARMFWEMHEEMYGPVPAPGPREAAHCTEADCLDCLPF